MPIHDQGYRRYGGDRARRGRGWIVIASAIMSWLVAFGVINVRNQFIRVVVDLLYRLTEPLLRPIRRFLPNLGGVDISPRRAAPGA